MILRTNFLVNFIFSVTKQNDLKYIYIGLSLTPRMDRDQFLSSYKELNKYVYNYVYFRVGYLKEVAEDITQESFIRAWKYKDSYNPKKSSIKVWLISISRNAVNDYFNKNPRLEELNEEILINTDHKSDTEEIDMLYLLNQLNSREKEIVRLRYMFEFKINEIAEILKEKPGNLKVEIFRIVQKLKDIFNTDKTNK
jgi:RNA polymerase sigma-70 factor (ECF subfamily)